MMMTINHQLSWQEIRFPQKNRNEKAYQMFQKPVPFDLQIYTDHLFETWQDHSCTKKPMNLWDIVHGLRTVCVAHTWSYSIGPLDGLVIPGLYQVHIPVLSNFCWLLSMTFLLLPSYFYTFQVIFLPWIQLHYDPIFRCECKNAVLYDTQREEDLD